AFGERFAYVFVLHDEGRHPHVHLTVRMSGRGGERLNPRKADLQLWRETFARRLRERGLEAEATPRRARGVVRKAERLPVRKLRERFAAGQAEAPRVLAAAVRSALEDPEAPAPWRAALAERRRRIARALLAEAVRLAGSQKAADRALGEAIVRFWRARPPIETRAQAIVSQVSRSRSGPERRR